MSEQKKDIYNKSEKAIDLDVHSSNALATVVGVLIEVPLCCCWSSFV